MSGREKKSRAKNSIRNASTSVMSYVITLILQMVSRTIFIQVLSVEYLGLNGLFTNVMQMLSLSELGIGYAIMYSLYKPIAENDTEKIKSLMSLYKKIYTFIGFFILGIGVIMTPFLRYLIKDMPDIPYIQIIFLLYVLDTGISYFYTYKRSLIICNQEEYLSSVTQLAKNVLTKVLQILVLLIWRNFLLYLIIQIICTRAENVAISKIADKKYPYLADRNSAPLQKEDMTAIKKNTLAIVCHKIGGVLVNATDNLIISKFLGLDIVGLVSNYTLLITSITSVTTRVMNSSIASVGNLLVDTNKKEAKNVFDRILFLNFVIYGICFVCMTCLIQDFISLWIGEQFVIDFSVVFVYTFYFYLTGMRKTVLIFRDAAGLFRDDRYKALVESILNLIISIPLTVCYGAVGVRAGSIIVCLMVPFWIEAYILYKHFWGKGLGKYFLKQFEYLVVTLGSCFLIMKVIGLISMHGWCGFFLKAFSCAIISCGLVFLLYGRSESFKYFFVKVKKIFVR